MCGWKQKRSKGRKLMGLPAEKWWAVFISCILLALSRGTPCRVACVADRRGRWQAPSDERTDGKNKKELSSFIDSILIKDNVKDTLWIKDKVNWSLY